MLRFRERVQVPVVSVVQVVLQVPVVQVQVPVVPVVPVVLQVSLNEVPSNCLPFGMTGLADLSTLKLSPATPKMFLLARGFA